MSPLYLSSFIQSISPLTDNLSELFECNLKEPDVKFQKNSLKHFLYTANLLTTLFCTCIIFIHSTCSWNHDFLMSIEPLCLTYIYVCFITALTACLDWFQMYCLSYLLHLNFSWLSYLLCLMISGTLASSQGIMGNEIRSNFAQLQSESLISNALLHKRVSRL